MKKLIVFLFFIISNTTMANSYRDFLSKREEIYKLKYDGLASVPIFSIIGMQSRNRKIKKKLKELKHLADTGKFTDYERSLVKSIIKVDEETNFSRKNSGMGLVDDYYVTPFGIKISTQCFEMIEKAASLKETNANTQDLRTFIYSMYSQGINHVGLENIDNKLIGQIKRSVDLVGKCSQNYPSAKIYFDQWLKSLKDTTIYCSKKLATRTLTLGYAIPDYMPALMNKNLYLSPEVFLTMVGNSEFSHDDQNTALNTFIHEVFHLGMVDNQAFSKHNNHNGKYFNDKCDGRDLLQDRVYFLSNLCTSDKKIITKSSFVEKNKPFSVDELMAMKIKKCGIKKGCQRYFDDNSDGIKFCQEMEKMGNCKLASRAHLSHSLPSKLNQHAISLYNKLDQMVKRCFDYSTKAQPKLKRPIGCPSKRYLELDRNAPLKSYFYMIKHSVPSVGVYGILDFEYINYLSLHPKTTSFLNKNQWKELKDFLFTQTDQGLSRHCAEKIRVKSHIKTILFPKTESCK